MPQIVFSLKLQMKRAAVSDLHEVLISLGYQIAEAEKSDKRFGASTRHAVLDFQQKHGLKPSGEVDELTVALLSQGTDVPQFVVHGVIRNQDGAPRPGLTIKAFGRNVGADDTLLGEATTDAQGNYSVTYTIEQLGGKPAADLVICVYQNDNLLQTSDVIFNAKRSETVELGVSDEHFGLSEYEKLVQTISPLLNNIPLSQLREDEQHKEITFLAGKTRIDQKQIHQLVQAAKLSEEIGLQTEVLYGLFRQHNVTDLSGILRHPPEAILQTIEMAASNNIVQKLTVDAKEDINLKLDDLTFKEALEQPAGTGRASLGSLVATVLPTEGQQRSFILRYQRHQGTLDDFLKADDWKANPDLKNHADDLQFMLQASELTQGNLSLVQKLQQQRKDGRMAGLRDLARFDNKNWENLVSEPSIENPQEEAKRLARSIEDKFATDVIAHRIVKDPIAHPEEVVTFFKNYLANRDEVAFDLRTTLVQDFLKKNASLLAGIAGERHKPLITALKTRQRVRKLTENADQMERLMRDGIHSAAQIAHMGRNAFIRKYGNSPEVDEKTAAKIYDNAQLASANAR